MSDITDRIAAWEQAGLIDAATAGRLRAAESDAGSAAERALGSAAEPASPAAPLAAPPTPPSARLGGRASAVGGFFGPTPTIPEMFSYLGGAFFIGAYSTFLTRIAGNSGDRELILTVGSAVGTAAMIAIALWLARGDAARRRGAGVLLLLAVYSSALTAAFVIQLADTTSPTIGALFVAGVVLGVGAFARIAVPAVASQAGFLSGVTAMGGAVLFAIERFFDGPGDEIAGIGAYDPPVSSIWRFVLLPAIGWLVVAVVIGLVGLRESRSTAPGADRRAGFSRFWAGIVAVAGVATGVMASGYLGADRYGRILEPWVGDVALLALAAVLVERAIRRDSAAFILPGAIALVIALTDFNFGYLTSSTDVGLVTEGVILLAVGYAADRLRRRLDRSSLGTADRDPAQAAAVS